MIKEANLVFRCVSEDICVRCIGGYLASILMENVAGLLIDLFESILYIFCRCDLWMTDRPQYLC